MPLQPRLEDRPQLVESKLLEVNLILELVHTLELRLDVVDGVLQAFVCVVFGLILLSLGRTVLVCETIASSTAADAPGARCTRAKSNSRCRGKPGGVPETNPSTTQSPARVPVLRTVTS